MTDLPTTPREVYAGLPLDALYAIDRRPLERLITARRACEAVSQATAEAEAELAEAARASYLAGEIGVRRVAVRSERFELSLSAT